MRLKHKSPFGNGIKAPLDEEFRKFERWLFDTSKISLPCPFSLTFLAWYFGCIFAKWWKEGLFAIYGRNFENSSKHGKLLRFDEKFHNFFFYLLMFVKLVKIEKCSNYNNRADAKSATLCQIRNVLVRQIFRNECREFWLLIYENLIAAYFTFAFSSKLYGFGANMLRF